MRSLMKTKVMAESGLKSTDYVSTPRATLNDKLGFGSAGSARSEPLETPDFNSMMDTLTNSINQGGAASDPIQEA